VFRVASNVAIDWHRRNARERAVVDDYAAMSGTEAYPDTLDTVSACQTIRRLEAAVQLLSFV
jgi:RNA polymerase sigma-70 factor (ECF subfamily)